MLQLFTIFHLNLAYSSIEEAQRPEVVRRCYWPLLRLAERGVPIGIEATGEDAAFGPALAVSSDLLRGKAFRIL